MLQTLPAVSAGVREVRTPRVLIMPRVPARVHLALCRGSEGVQKGGSVVGYLGSKAGAGVYQAIIALMPPHDTYVELFVGTGAVLQRKLPAAQSYAIDRFKSVLDKIPAAAGLTKIHGDARSFLDNFNYGVHGRTLFYADPPYLLSTRSSRNRYHFELTDEEHVGLLQRLLLCPAQVILSGYPSSLYDSMLEGWRTREFQAMTRGGVRTEKLWFNFEPTAVHCATFAGRNFTDRQRIKRKAARWKRMYGQLPAGERLAILAGILEVDQAESSPSTRSAQLRMAMQPATQTRSTIAAGAHECDRLWPIDSPLPDSGAIKPGPAAGGTLEQAATAC